MVLRRLIGTYCREDEGFRRAMQKVDRAIIEIGHERSWPRDRPPSWQGIVLEELVHIARINNLLDVSERPRPPRGKELIEPVL